MTVLSGNTAVACGATVNIITLPNPPARQLLKSLTLTLTAPAVITNILASGRLNWAFGAFNYSDPDNGSPRVIGNGDSGVVMTFTGNESIPGGSTLSISYGASPGFDCAIDGLAALQIHYDVTYVPQPNPILFGTANNSSFDARQQRRLIQRHGDIVDWFQARKCTCSPDGDPNRANINCRVCRGLGYFYKDSKRVRGLITSISSQKMLLESGIALPGDMVFSEDFMPRDVFSDFDMIRLTLRKGQPYEGELLTRGSGIVDHLTYMATQIVDVYQNDPVAEVTRPFFEGTDFLFVSGTTDIVWQTTVNRPAPGSAYGVKYYAIFDWIVFTPPNDRFERGTSLGNRVLLRKKHTVLAARQQ